MQPKLVSEHKLHGDGTFDTETRVYKLHARIRCSLQCSAIK